MSIRDEILTILIQFGQSQEKIRSVVQTGKRALPDYSKDSSLDYEMIYGVLDLMPFRNPKFLKEIFGEPLIFKKTDGLKMIQKATKDSLVYEMILDTLEKITLSFILEEKMQDYINGDSKAKILVDKEGGLRGNEYVSDISYRQSKPTQQEFLDTCQRFFMSALKMAKGLYRGKVIYSISVFGEMRKALDEMTAFYIGAEYDFRVSLGENYEFLENYLDPEMYEFYLQTFPQPDRDSLWKALFNSCMLFRKEGLEISRKIDYEYPKRADRDILQEIRRIHNLYIQI